MCSSTARSTHRALTVDFENVGGGREAEVAVVDLLEGRTRPLEVDGGGVEAPFHDRLVENVGSEVDGCVQLAGGFEGLSGDGSVEIRLKDLI